jgi:DNA invertase Pin-like site-specific DNA recombinase
MSDSLAKKRGVIFVRVSSDDQQKTGYSIPSQIRLLREKMKSDGVEEVHEPIMDVESGMNPNSERKGLKVLWELAYNKIIDYVYFLDIDRFGRHYAETPYLMYTLKELGVICRDLKDEYNFKDPIQYVWVVIRCFQGHSESVKIGERTQRGKNEKFEQGKWIGRPPFGYRKNEKEELEKIPELEPIIHDIFVTYKTLRDIKKTTLKINQKYMDKIGRLSTDQIETILKNPIYIGRPRYAKKQIDVPALRVVPADLFASVQSLLESKGKKHKAAKVRNPESVISSYAREYGSDYVLRELKVLKPICPKCGSTMVGNGSKLLKRLNIRVANFLCTKAGCQYQRTVPSEKELEHLQKNHVSCPTCRAVEDYDKTVALDGSIRCVCRRCGTSFQFTPTKEMQKIYQEKGNPVKHEEAFAAKLPANSPEGATPLGEALFLKAVELTARMQSIVSAGFQLSKDAFYYLIEIAATRDPVKILDETVRRLEALQTKPFLIRRSDLEL